MNIRMVSLVDMDVWRQPRDCSVFARGPRLPQTISIQMEERCERFEEELNSFGQSLDGRLRQILFRSNGIWSGELLHLLPFGRFHFYEQFQMKTIYGITSSNELIRVSKGDYGDISDRIALRKSLKCKSFDWYVKNIYPELFIPGEAAATGEIRNLAFNGEWCIDRWVLPDVLSSNLHEAFLLVNISYSHSNQIFQIIYFLLLFVVMWIWNSKGTADKVVSMYRCHGQGGNQYWLFSKTGEIRRDDLCVDYAGGDITLYPCHGSKGNQYWKYDVEVSDPIQFSNEKWQIFMA